MSGRRRAERNTLALQFDMMSLAILVVLLRTLASSVAEIGPDQALDRVGCGLDDVVNALLQYPQQCR